MVKHLTLVSGLVAAACLGGLSRADTHSQRQYYSGWHKHPSYTYHYRHYYYKPTPTYSGYKHHYVIYHPHKPDHLYFYNPYKKQYWGRCPVRHQGREAYEVLDERDRKGNLEEIEETAFGKGRKGNPPIPESSDGAILDQPPDDLPVGEKVLPPGKATPGKPAKDSGG